MVRQTVMTIEITVLRMLSLFCAKAIENKCNYNCDTQYILKVDYFVICRNYI